MPDLRTTVDRVRTTSARLRDARGASVRARLRELEAEVQESRRLNRRVAELTDLVTELSCRWPGATRPGSTRSWSATAR
jgi:hypothetical protein